MTRTKREPAGKPQPVGQPNSGYLTEMYNKEDAMRQFARSRLQKHNMSGAMKTSFTFSSAFTGRDSKTDFSKIDERLRGETVRMQEELERKKKSSLARTGNRTTLPRGSRNINSIGQGRRKQQARTGTALCLGGGFKFSAEKLESQNFGEHQKKKFTTRVSIRDQKKAGGVMLHDNPYDSEEEEKKKDDGNKFTADKYQLKLMRMKLEREMKDLDKEIDDSLVKRDEVRERVVEAKKELEESEKARRPLAMRDGQMFGDMSLKIPVKKINASVTSDAMQAIMKNLPNRPETAPPPRKILKNNSTQRSVEASFNDWMNELGKH
ncbi:hypothetical protein TrST_g13532 [Triparma strigata]|uniref:Uncharacterized protein n=1 Tax=Triparma strigata TaxID=1606541 RepID=A0A9W7ACI9_9STRA|nr:hypothetical protein TrST_g13532 [Triparma strigata]